MADKDINILYIFISEMQIKTCIEIPSHPSQNDCQENKKY